MNKNYFDLNDGVLVSVNLVETSDDCICNMCDSEVEHYFYCINCFKFRCENCFNKIKNDPLLSKSDQLQLSFNNQHFKEQINSLESKIDTINNLKLKFVPKPYTNSNGWTFSRYPQTLKDGTTQQLIDKDDYNKHIHSCDVQLKPLEKELFSTLCNVPTRNSLYDENCSIEIYRNCIFRNSKDDLIRDNSFGPFGNFKLIFNGNHFFIFKHKINNRLAYQIFDDHGRSGIVSLPDDITLNDLHFLHKFYFKCNCKKNITCVGENEDDYSCNCSQELSWKVMNRFNFPYNFG